MKLSLLIHGFFTFSALQGFGQEIKTDSAYIKPIGKLVPMGGYQLHLNCTGRGEATVILISGSQGFSFNWTLVQSTLSQLATTCSYDRPGLAWSDPGPMPRSLSQDVYELHKLLETANIKPPYILAGHSIGGIIARKFAAQYPGKVSGLVLVDATSEKTLLNINGKIERLRLLASPVKQIAPLKEKVDSFTRIPAKKDIEDLWAMIGKPAINSPFDKLPPSIRDTRLWAQSQPKYYAADNGEFWAEKFAAMYADSLSYQLGNKPLIVLCSVKNEYPAELGLEITTNLLADKLQNQQRFLHLSSNSKLITTSKSGHEIQLSEPELVVNAIKEIITVLASHSNRPSTIRYRLENRTN